MGWNLTTCYLVRETRTAGREKEKTREKECYSEEDAKKVIIEWSNDISENDMDGYYLDSYYGISMYQWKIKVYSKLIYNA